MDARQALDDLMEISAQLDAALLVRSDGTVEASTIVAEEPAEAAAAAARRLLEAASDVEGSRALTHVEIVTPHGSAFLVREGSRAAVGVTGPSPTAGLVLYDLRTCLRNVDEGEADAGPVGGPGASSGAAGDA